MSNQELLETVEDLEVRQYVRLHLDEMTKDVLTTMEALEEKPDLRLELYAAGGNYLRKFLEGVIPGFDYDEIKAAISKRMWGLFCVKDNDKGKPEDRWKEILDKEGVGTQIVEAALVAAFGALGTALGGAVGAFLGSAIGKAIQEFLKQTVREELDQWVEGKLDTYCEKVSS